MIGVALRSADSMTSRPGRRADASARASAWRRMRSASRRFPLVMSLAWNRMLVRLTGTCSYLVFRATPARRGMSARPADGRGGLCAVLAATLLAVAHAGGVEGAADDVVLDRGQVLDPAAADEHDRVLLQVVADARDVGRDLHLVGQAHARDLAQRGVRLLGRHRPHLEAHAALLRGARNRHLALAQAVPVLAHRRRLDLADLGAPAVAHELVDRRHENATSAVGLVGSRRRRSSRDPSWEGSEGRSAGRRRASLPKPRTRSLSIGGSVCQTWNDPR